MTGQKAKTIRVLIQVLCIAAITLLLATVLVIVCGASPAEAYGLFMKGIFGSSQSFAEIFVKACPLILTGLGCAVAYQTGFFTIGAEGQFYVGALTATIVVLKFQNTLPGPAVILMAVVTAFVTGGIWAFIAAVFKAKFNISEIIVTIMLNYIAINFLGYSVRGYLQDPEGHVPQSAKVISEVQLKSFIPATRFHAGIVIAFVCVVITWFLMKKTTVGYALKAVGYNKRASECVGIPVMRNIILSAVLSGGFAGLAGIIEVLATQKKLIEGISGGCGYTAVLVALIAFNNPVGVLFVSIFYAAMEVGAGSMQRKLGVPSAIVDILIGTVVILILARKIFVPAKLKEGRL